MVSSEAAPLAKTGGLADVVASLPVALQESGDQAAVVIPRYGSIDLKGSRRVYDAAGYYIQASESGESHPAASGARARKRNPSPRTCGPRGAVRAAVRPRPVAAGTGAARASVELRHARRRTQRWTSRGCTRDGRTNSRARSASRWRRYGTLALTAHARGLRGADSPGPVPSQLEVSRAAQKAVALAQCPTVDMALRSPRQPASTSIWTGLAGCLDVLILAYALTIVTYHCKIA